MGGPCYPLDPSSLRCPLMSLMGQGRGWAVRDRKGQRSAQPEPKAREEAGGTVVPILLHCPGAASTPDHRWKPRPRLADGEPSP